MSSQPNSFSKTKSLTTLLLTFIVWIIILVVLSKGYTVIYPYALNFAISRPNISASQQASMAKFFTYIVQMSIINLFCRCQESFNLLTKNEANTNRFDILFPIIHGVMLLPFTYILATVFFSKTTFNVKVLGC